MFNAQFYIDAENALIGSILEHGEKALDSIKVLIRENDFVSPVNSLIFKHVVRMVGDGLAIDPMSVAIYIESSGIKNDYLLKYMGDLTMAGCSLKNVPFYARILKERSILRALETRSQEVPGIIARYDMSAQEKMVAIEQGIVDILDDAMVSGDSIVSTKDLVTPHMELMERRVDGNEFIISTGFTDLDELLCGGFREEQFIVIGGRPSMGKTTLGLNIARHAAMSNIPVGIFSLEMSNLQLMDKLISDIGSIDNNNIRRGNMTEEEYTKYAHAIRKLSEIPLYIDESGGLTISDIEKRIRQMVRRYGVKLVLIDYIQLIVGDDRRVNRAEQIENISNRIKRLAKRLKISIIGLAQLNRGANSENRPTMAHLRNSGAIEQDADIVIFPYREERDKADTDKKGIAEIIVAKQREGETGVKQLFFDGVYSRFRQNPYGVSNGNTEYKNQTP